MRSSSQFRKTEREIDQVFAVLRKHDAAETRIYKELAKVATREKRYTSGGFVDQTIRKRFVGQLALLDKDLFSGLWKFVKTGRVDLAKRRLWALQKYFEWWVRLREAVAIASGTKIEPSTEKLENARRVDFEVYKFPFWMTETERRCYLPFGVFYRKMDRWAGHGMRATWGSQEPSRSARAKQSLKATRSKNQASRWYRQLRGQGKSQEACLQEIHRRLKSKPAYSDYQTETLKRIVGMRRH